ncbi:hypothetical protein DMC30DRAFT_213626 [Rhodotorula diobovata]|uniref:Uncharacterized protein n=1 Tax=Rhodotorula diobovata TaxID=5288 RepID=A0A5C5G4L7_9BASI|nr:hypothetical protein DMC30DRAFT_213626 [Rhodotorula diobovata]
MSQHISSANDVCRNRGSAGVADRAGPQAAKERRGERGNLTHLRNSKDTRPRDMRSSPLLHPRRQSSSAAAARRPAVERGGRGCERYPRGGCFPRDAPAAVASAELRKAAGTLLHRTPLAAAAEGSTEAAAGLRRQRSPGRLPAGPGGSPAGTAAAAAGSLAADRSPAAARCSTPARRGGERLESYFWPGASEGEVRGATDLCGHGRCVGSESM